MNKIIEQIEADFIQALKQKNQLRVETLRMLKGAISVQEKKAGQTPTASEIISIIQAEIKKRDQAIEGYQKALRAESAQKEQKEKAILIQYLPRQLPEEALVKIIDQAIAETGASSVREMGLVMAKVMAQTKGQATGEKVSQLVKQKLG